MFLVLFVVALFSWQIVTELRTEQPAQSTLVSGDAVSSELAANSLNKLVIKGRASFSGYSRSQFGDGWASVTGCDMRNTILYRDLYDSARNGPCTVRSGTLNDPYTGRVIEFLRGNETSDDVQIDHVVALADAWQKGAQLMSADDREIFANDPLNLLAVDGPTNVQKGSSDAASWLPPNKVYRCRYVARQIAVKVKYALWVTQAEYNAMQKVLQTCPEQRLPVVG